MVPGGVSGASWGQQETLGSSNEPSLKPPLAAQHGSSYANCDDLHVSTTHALSHCDKHEGHKSGRSSRVQQLTPMAVGMRAPSTLRPKRDTCNAAFWNAPL